MTARTNGGCNCSDCYLEPAIPVDHLARLEATDDIWPTTEGV